MYDGVVTPFLKGSGLLDLVTAVTDQGALFFPVAMEIISIRSRVRVACGTASGTAEVGTPADPDYFGTQAHATTDAAGTEIEWTIINSLIPAGTVLAFSANGGATSTGSCDVTVVCRPVADPA
jgi:hypothetical protein